MFKKNAHRIALLLALLSLASLITVVLHLELARAAINHQAPPPQRPTQLSPGPRPRQLSRSPCSLPITCWCGP